jgi:hypothetical protein
VQNAQEFLLPKLKQKYVLWFCCDGGYFNKHSEEEEREAKGANDIYEELNIRQLDEDDPRIKQVSCASNSNDIFNAFLSSTECPRERKGRVQHVR